MLSMFVSLVDHSHEKYIISVAKGSLFVSPAKHSRHIGIMSPSSASAISHFWFSDQ